MVWAPDSGVLMFVILNSQSSENFEKKLLNISIFLTNFLYNQNLDNQNLLGYFLRKNDPKSDL